MDSLTVACVYIPGKGFTDEYVTRLHEAVKTTCRVPHRFVVLTTEKLRGIETAPLSRNVPGWWNKLDLFRPNLFSGPVAYFDLDTMLVGDITDIVTTPQTFAVLRDFYGKSRIGSGVMIWNADLDWSYLYEGFSSRHLAAYSKTMERWGDQGWISDCLLDQPTLLQDVFPGRFVSYKVDIRRQGSVPPGASVVCFHGKPRPADIGWRLP